MREDGLFGRVLEETRPHHTPLAQKMETALRSSPNVLASQEFYAEELSTCLKHRPDTSLQEAVAKSLLPDAGIYLIVGFDAAGRTSFLYIGKSVRMSVRTVTHTVMYDNGGDERSQLYRLAQAAHQVYHLPLLRIADEQASGLVLAAIEPMWSVALGTCQRNSKWMEARRGANLTNVGDVVAGVNRECLASCFLASHLPLR